MEHYTIWIGAALSFLSVLISVKKLFGDIIEKWIESRKNEKQNQHRLREDMTELQKQIMSLAQSSKNTYDCILKGKEYDEMYLKDREELMALTRTTIEQDLLLKNISQGLLAMARDRILHLIKKHLSDGYITIPDLENIQELYDAYRAMGGNHVVCTLMKEILALPKREK